MELAFSFWHFLSMIVVPENVLARLLSIFNRTVPENQHNGNSFNNQPTCCGIYSRSPLDDPY